MINFAFYNPDKRTAVQNAMKEEISNALKSGFTQEEFDAAMKGWLNQRKAHLHDNHRINALIIKKLMYGIPLEQYDEVTAKTQALNVAQVNKALVKYIDPNRISSVYIGDFKSK